MRGLRIKGSSTTGRDESRVVTRRRTEAFAALWKARLICLLCFARCVTNMIIVTTAAMMNAHVSAVPMYTEIMVSSWNTARIGSTVVTVVVVVVPVVVVPVVVVVVSTVSLVLSVPPVTINVSMIVDSLASDESVVMMSVVIKRGVDGDIVVGNSAVDSAAVVPAMFASRWVGAERNGATPICWWNLHEPSLHEVAVKHTSLWSSRLTVMCRCRRCRRRRRRAFCFLILLFVFFLF